MQYGINDDIFDNIINVLKKYSCIKKVYLFGSRARGDYRKVSDIDLAIVSDEDVTLKVLRDLDELRCILTFDVVDYNYIGDNLKFNIDKDKKVIYKR